MPAVALEIPVGKQDFPGSGPVLPPSFHRPKCYFRTEDDIVVMTLLKRANEWSAAQRSCLD